jgi:hypothetical protein
MLSDMKRFLIIISLFIVSAGHMTAGDGCSKTSKFTWGVEWGYVASFHYGIHHNFFSEDGYRVDIDNSSEFSYQGNGDVYIHLGCDLSDRLNLSVYSGLTGMHAFHKAIPVSLRLSRYFDLNKGTDKLIAFADAGSGLCIKDNMQLILSGKIGGGYRITLSPSSSIDILLAYRMTLTHPEVIYDGYTVPMKWINRNNAYISAISVSLGLNF